jgi:hypothetical protein
MRRLLTVVAEHFPKSLADWLIMRHDDDVACNDFYHCIAFERLYDMLDNHIVAGLTEKERALYWRCNEMVQH